MVWILWSLIVVWGGVGGGGDKEDFVWCMKASISALELLIIWWLNRTNFGIVNYCPVLTLSNCQNKTLLIIINNYKVNNFDEGKSQIWITLQVPQKGIFNNIFEYLCDNVLCYVRIYTLITTVMHYKSSFIIATYTSKCKIMNKKANSIRA